MKRCLERRRPDPPSLAATLTKSKGRSSLPRITNERPCRCSTEPMPSALSTQIRNGAAISARPTRLKLAQKIRPPRHGAPLSPQGQAFYMEPTTLNQAALVWMFSATLRK